VCAAATADAAAAAAVTGKGVELLPFLLQSKDAPFKIVLPAFLGMLLAGMLVANLPGACFILCLALLLT
jgi:hypothetical protein